MERETWERNSFFISIILDWNCPNCDKGNLKISENEFHYKETNKSKKQELNYFGERDFPKYIFNGFLECDRCNDKVVFIGNGERKIFDIYNEKEKEYDNEFLNEFYPVYFHPTLKIITIPNECPESVSKIIKQSFSLFWNDISSCANKLRASLEILLDELEVERTECVKNGKTREISLHDRIKKYSNKNREISELLLAIKWVGNAGTHIGNIEKKDLINCYETIELLLHKLYGTKKEEDLKSWAKETNEKYNKRK